MTEEIQLIGRYEQEVRGISFSWPGFKVKGSFTGSELSIEIKSSGCYLLIEIDNKRYKQEITSDEKFYTLAEGLNYEYHKFSITLCHEMDEKVLLEAVTTDGEFLTIPRNNLNIEFIGDSLTVGYGNRAPGIKWDRADSYQYYTSSFDSFASVAGRKLNADTVLTAFSGKGLTHNYNNDSPGVTVPLFYDSIHRFVGSPKWDESVFTPDITIINLGTNDFSNDIENDAWIDSYLGFIKEILNKHPVTKIILISPNGVDKGAVKKVALKADCTYYSYNVSYTALDSHPNVDEHREIAEGLVKVIKGLIEES